MEEKALQKHRFSTLKLALQSGIHTIYMLFFLFISRPSYKSLLEYYHKTISEEISDSFA